MDKNKKHYHPAQHKINPYKKQNNQPNENSGDEINNIPEIETIEETEEKIKTDLEFESEADANVDFVSENEDSIEEELGTEETTELEKDVIYNTDAYTDVFSNSSDYTDIYSDSHADVDSDSDYVIGNDELSEEESKCCSMSESDETTLRGVMLGLIYVIILALGIIIGSDSLIDINIVQDYLNPNDTSIGEVTPNPGDDSQETIVPEVIIKTPEQMNKDEILAELTKAMGLFNTAASVTATEEDKTDIEIKKDIDLLFSDNYQKSHKSVTSSKVTNNTFIFSNGKTKNEKGEMVAVENVICGVNFESISEKITTATGKTENGNSVYTIEFAETTDESFIGEFKAPPFKLSCIELINQKTTYKNSVLVVTVNSDGKVIAMSKTIPAEGTATVKAGLIECPVTFGGNTNENWKFTY